ncbi:outer membrane protein assembly factor BamB family protein [Pyrococcus yayanosii]|uniref:Pyrrolo-quinoline quinone repeat domain-containing protein n=1 Tax=Pyrococcus yayanosii (strain CH1 / JCM 16557) TaxID=529709 RepID=F8AF96_PYRYC|nr:PQQ-binding-like beta-propeller repeat protein [Pyrococcus yayanosii]AEH24926.1 hypothetical protein PYCH_12480 [Pyrococcus yayanosii CH1]
MKRALALILLLIPFAMAQDVILWKGSPCEDVPYQKTIEAVAISNGTIYAGCSYKWVVNGTGLISVYYLGVTAAYSTNGTMLWTNDSGFVMKLYPLPEGKILVGSIGGLVVFDENGRYVDRFLVEGKLYDFSVDGDEVYLVSGDVGMVGNRSYPYGFIYKVRLLPNGTIVKPALWSLNLSTMPDRVRVGDVIYVGSGFPSGYTSRHRFGELLGINPDGRLLWNVSLGEWVRDIDLWNGKAVVGTGFGREGKLLVVDGNGNVLLERELFFVEDVEVHKGMAYVGGAEENGKLAAVDLNTGRVVWERDFPYRVKVVKWYEGKLLVGTGKFETKEEDNRTVVYNIGELFVVDPRNGKILKELSLGYVRSIAIESDTVVVGTGSGDFFVLDGRELSSKGVCGPGLTVLLTLFALPLGKKALSL